MPCQEVFVSIDSLVLDQNLFVISINVVLVSQVMKLFLTPSESIRWAIFLGTATAFEHESACLALFADQNACPQLFADVVFQYPAKKHPMHQPMYDILAGPPLLPTSFVRPLDRNVSPQLFADFVFIHLDKHIIHTWNEIAD